MTGFIPPQDFRYQNNEFQMVRVRNSDIPCSFRVLAESDPDFPKGKFRIEFRSSPVDVGETLTIVDGPGRGEYIATHIYDPYRTLSDRSMKGRFVAVVANAKGA